MLVEECKLGFVGILAGVVLDIQSRIQAEVVLDTQAGILDANVLPCNATKPPIPAAATLVNSHSCVHSTCIISIQMKKTI